MRPSPPCHRCAHGGCAGRRRIARRCARHLPERSAIRESRRGPDFRGADLCLTGKWDTFRIQARPPALVCSLGRVAHPRPLPHWTATRSARARVTIKPGQNDPAWAPLSSRAPGQALPGASFSRSMGWVIEPPPPSEIPLRLPGQTPEIRSSPQAASTAPHPAPPAAQTPRQLQIETPSVAAPPGSGYCETPSSSSFDPPRFRWHIQK